MVGTVLFWSNELQYGEIQDDATGRVYASRSQIAPDEYFQRYLIEGEPVLFTDSGVRKGKKPAAKNVEPGRCDTSLDTPEDHREIMTVVKWEPEKGVGFLRRDKNFDWIRLKEVDVLTEGEIAVGVKVYTGFERDTKYPNKFRARNVEICREVKTKE
jgi:cold shock CspA family protein